VESVEGWVYYMGVVIVEGKEAVFGLNLGRPIVTNGDFTTRLFPNYFGLNSRCTVYRERCDV